MGADLTPAILSGNPMLLHLFALAPWALAATAAAATDSNAQLCLEHVNALDYASASASCQRAADDVAASADDRAAALLALGTSLAALEEDDVAVDAFVKLLVIDDTARLADDAGAGARAAFDRARVRLLRDGAVRARVEQSEQADGRTVRIDVVIGADALHRVAGAREVDDRGRVRMQASDDDRFTVEVQKDSSPLPYRVELLGPADSVVLTDETLAGVIAPPARSAPAPAAAAATTTSPRGAAATHVVRGAAAWDVNGWSYAFDGGGVGDARIASSTFIGASLRADARPLAPFGYPWLGVDADLALASLPFSISSADIAIAPSSFDAVQTRAGISLAARYTFDTSGVALGVRGGYRYYGQSVEAQTADVDGVLEPLTVVPGFTSQGVALGVDALWPIDLFGNHVELEARAEGIPLELYQEQPDNPGAAVHGLGWDAGVAARVRFVDVVFVELRLQTVGASETYTEQGSRQAIVGSSLERTQGGAVVNMTNTLSLGAGATY